MRPLSRDQAGPEQTRQRRAEQRVSGRAQRKIAEEQAARRKRLAILGSAMGVALLIALVVFLITRTREAAGTPLLAAEPLPASIPVSGMSMGPEDAPVTVAEWGDFT
jgi:hypothetical protein